MQRALLSLGVAALFLSLAGAPAGCGGSGTTTSTTTSSTSTTTSGGTGGSGGSTSTTGTGGSGTGGTGTGGNGTGGNGTGGNGTGGSGGSQFEAQACADAKGVCVGQGECVPAGGTVVGNGPSGCHFDDVPVAECCAPPKAKPSPVTCNDQGGICGTVTGCLEAGGYFTSNKADCNGGPIAVCCVPHSACGDQTIDCCDGGAVYNPACDNGKFMCVIGSPAPVGMCP
ncbi:MAG: hypothetical protein U0359_08605 [Byssovorax sp.]